MTDITGTLTRQAIKEFMQISYKSIDWIASCVGVDTPTLRLWMNDPHRNGIDHQVAAFLQTHTPEPPRVTHGVSGLRPTKFCPGCRQTLPMTQFRARTGNTHLIRDYCRDCLAARTPTEA